MNMNMENIVQIINKVSEKVTEKVSEKLFYNPDEKILKAPKTTLDDELREAHQEWVRAQKFFEHVSDPDLVDYAIYNQEAAMKRYMYLLKKAREQGLFVQ